MKLILRIAIGATTFAVAGCGATTGESAVPGTTAEAMPTSIQAQTEQTEAPAPPPITRTEAAPATVEAVMPDVVCMNLQDAQNTIQEAGVFFSRSTDATGAGRAQVLDRNWIVVSQDPAAGQPISEGDADLSVVKLDEPHTCG